jgi:hypothetical protein
MELVSMLACESFTDRPATACPVIASFLRSYNDLVTDGRRQSLLGCASAVVDSRRPGYERDRIERCHALAVELWRGRPAWRRASARLLDRSWVSARAPSDDAEARDRLCWKLALLLRSHPDGPARALALVEELAAMGSPSVVPHRPIEGRHQWPLALFS